MLLGLHPSAIRPQERRGTATGSHGSMIGRGRTVAQSTEFCPMAESAENRSEAIAEI